MGRKHNEAIYHDDNVQTESMEFNLDKSSWGTDESIRHSVWVYVCTRSKWLDRLQPMMDVLADRPLWTQRSAYMDGQSEPVGAFRLHGQGHAFMVPFHSTALIFDRFFGTLGPATTAEGKLREQFKMLESAPRSVGVVILGFRWRFIPPSRFRNSGLTAAQAEASYREIAAEAWLLGTDLSIKVAVSEKKAASSGKRKKQPVPPLATDLAALMPGGAGEGSVVPPPNWRDRKPDYIKRLKELNALLTFKPPTGGERQLASLARRTGGAGPRRGHRRRR